MRGIYGYIPLIGVLAVGLTVAAFIRPISGWFKANRAISIGAVIGHITHVEGSVRRLHGEDIELIPVNLDKPIELRDGDRIQTSVASKADFSLENGGGNFEIPEGSGVLFERWEALKDGSPVYMRVLFGGLNGGASNREHYVIKGEKLYFAGQTETGEPAGVKVKSAPPSGAREFVQLSTRPMADRIHPRTLSIEYVNARIEASAADFNACREPGAEAQLELALQIAPDGRAKSELSKASPKNERLNSCVNDVMGRIPFRPFTGPALNLNFRLGFE